MWNLHAIFGKQNKAIEKPELSYREGKELHEIYLSGKTYLQYANFQNDLDKKTISYVFHLDGEKRIVKGPSLESLFGDRPIEVRMICSNDRFFAKSQTRVQYFLRNPQEQIVMIWVYLPYDAHGLVEAVRTLHLFMGEIVAEEEQKAKFGFAEFPIVELLPMLADDSRSDSFKVYENKYGLGKA